MGPSVRRNDESAVHVADREVAVVDDASESLLARVNLVSYDGAIGLDLPILMAGTTTIGAESQILGTGLTLLWRPVLDSGDKWSWAAAATIPWVWVDVTADVNVLGPRGRQVSKEITSSANSSLFETETHRT